MNVVYGLTILLVYQLVGEVGVHFLQVPIPGPVLGMALLFMTLFIRGAATAALDTASTGLLSHLSLLFVPAGVGMIVHLDRIREEWLPLIVALVVSTLLTMAVAAGVMLAAQRLITRWSGGRE